MRAEEQWLYPPPNFDDDYEPTDEEWDQHQAAWDALQDWRDKVSEELLNPVSEARARAKLIEEPLREEIHRIFDLIDAGGLDEAAERLTPMMTQAEQADLLVGAGDPDHRVYWMLADVYHTRGDYVAELQVTDRYLRSSSEEHGQGRPGMVDRFREVWELVHGNDDAEDPPALDITNTLAGRLDRYQERSWFERDHAEARASAQFLASPPFDDEEKEAKRRMDHGFPSDILDREAWHSVAGRWAGQFRYASVLIETLLAHADKWGVVVPDDDVVENRFSIVDHDYGWDVHDGETGDRIVAEDGGGAFSYVEVWLAAETGLPLPDVARFIRDGLGPANKKRGLLVRSARKNHWMHNKATLTYSQRYHR